MSRPHAPDCAPADRTEGANETCTGACCPCDPCEACIGREARPELVNHSGEVPAGAFR